MNSYNPFQIFNLQLMTTSNSKLNYIFKSVDYCVSEWFDWKSLLYIISIHFLIRSNLIVLCCDSKIYSCLDFNKTRTPLLIQHATYKTTAFIIPNGGTTTKKSTYITVIATHCNLDMTFLRAFVAFSYIPLLLQTCCFESVF